MSGYRCGGRNSSAQPCNSIEAAQCIKQPESTKKSSPCPQHTQFVKQHSNINHQIQNNPNNYDPYAAKAFEAQGTEALDGAVLERSHYGRVVVAPVAMDDERGYGFIYNEKDRNMVTILHDIHVQFDEGMHVQFNEIERPGMHSRTDYVAIDVIPMLPMRGPRNNAPPPHALENNGHKMIHKNSRANPPIKRPQIQSAAMRAFPIQPDPIKNEIEEKTLQHTTPELNAKPIPPDTEEGRRQLSGNLQIKINAMHVIDAYKGADEIPNAMSLMEAGMYGHLACAWESLINLENKTIKQIESNKINKRNDIKMQQSDALLARSVHQLRSQPPMQAIKQILNANRFNEKVEAVAMGLNDNVIPEAEILVDDMSCLDLAQHIDKDEHGLPILPDQSKYKAVALEFCQKKGWKKPTELHQNSPSGIGYRGTVTFGKPGEERSASGEGRKQKSALYDAYRKLVPVVIPKLKCRELMAKWLHGYVKQKKVRTSTLCGHPKSEFLEWCQKNGKAHPESKFKEFSDPSSNFREFTCIVEWNSMTFRHKAGNKKEAEKECYRKLLCHVMNSA